MTHAGALEPEVLELDSQHPATPQNRERRRTHQLFPTRRQRLLTCSRTNTEIVVVIVVVEHTNTERGRVCYFPLRTWTYRVSMCMLMSYRKRYL